jgi:hypothetical protein
MTMSKIIRIMNGISLIGCIGLSVYNAYLAWAWLTIGYGLNPWVSLPLAGVFAALAGMVWDWLRDQEADSSPYDYCDVAGGDA